MLERVRFRGWTNAYRVANTTVELIILADVGPRVIAFRFIGGENIFHEVAGQAGLIGGSAFRLYGGHRLWVWPETEHTYFPDNAPVAVMQHDDAVRFTAPVESGFSGSSLQKELEIRLDEAEARVTVTHCVTNRGSHPTELAVWAPTMMRAGGRAILPLPPRAAMDKDHFQSVGPLALWSFTDLADPRWALGAEFVQLHQQSDPKGRFQEQMAGIFNPAGWGAYFVDEMLFIKRASVISGATYPDFGCNFEVFTNPEFLELETLGARVRLEPGEASIHTERWTLFRGVAAGEGEEWIRRVVAPRAMSGDADR